MNRIADDIRRELRQEILNWMSRSSNEELAYELNMPLVEVEELPQRDWSFDECFAFAQAMHLRVFVKVTL